MVRMSKISEVKAVVFDMDGLLLDSERIALATFISACRECGFEPDVEVYYRCVGVNEAKTKQILIEGYGDKYPFEKVDKLWHARYEEEAEKRPFPLKPGVKELLEFLERRGIKKACATSTRHASAERKLNNARILRYFDFIIGGDEIVKCKPDPEIYLKACEKLNIIPSECLALEDSDNGVLSAYAAGMQVVQVPDMLQPSDKVKALGHRILGSLDDVRKSFETA
jgi:HAD superfamily hydrolase (TIGR01509 family)